MLTKKKIISIKILTRNKYNQFSLFNLTYLIINNDLLLMHLF